MCIGVAENKNKQRVKGIFLMNFPCCKKEKSWYIADEGKSN